MDVSEAVAHCATTCVAISRPPHEYPMVGVLIQGSSYPLVASSHHGFIEMAVVAKRFSATLINPEEDVEIEVIDFNVELDFILFKVLSLISHRRTARIEFAPDFTSVGRPYFMFGYSSVLQQDPNGHWQLAWRMSPGFFATGLNNHFLIAGSSGCVSGDSGGPVFSPITCHLLGINVVVSNLHPATSDSVAVRMQTSPECMILPMWFACHSVGRHLFLEGGCSAQVFSSGTKTSAVAILDEATQLAMREKVPSFMTFCGATGEITGKEKERLHTFQEWLQQMSRDTDPYY